MGVYEIAELLLKLGMTYGPVAYAAAKKWIEEVTAAPMTTPEEKAKLQALLVRADAWEQRVITAPDIPRWPE